MPFLLTGESMATSQHFRALAVLTLCISINKQATTVAYAQTTPAKLHIVIVEGEGAINNVRQRVAREPIVQVEDENRKPVAGAAVTFLLPQQGAGATFPNGARSATLLTDNNGRVVARGLRPNNVNGQFEIRITASKEGQTASATISQTNAVAAGAAVGAGAGAGISAKVLAIIVVAAAATAGGVVAATRIGDNDGQNGGTTVIVPGTPTVGGPQ
jgi:hypothetical protein